MMPFEPTVLQAAAADGHVPLWVVGVAVAPFITGMGIVWRQYISAERERNAERVAEKRERAEEIRIVAVALHDSANALREVADAQPLRNIG